MSKKEIAYSKFFKSFITVESYEHDNNWYFYLCDRKGNLKSTDVYKARSDYMEFNWKEVGDVSTLSVLWFKISGLLK